MTPNASGAKRITTFKRHETSKLASAVSRKPAPRIQNERRAPARPTKKPALTLTPTISRKPSHICGVCSGASPRATSTTNAVSSESISPARQTAHVTAPAVNEKSRELTRDFQVNVFNFDWSECAGRDEAVRPTRLYTAEGDFGEENRAICMTRCDFHHKDTKTQSI